MSADELRKSIDEYKEQLNMIKEALRVAKDNNEKGPLETLAADLNQLVQLTQESLDAVLSKASDSTMNTTQTNTVEFTNELDSEYALFMQEMASSGAYESENGVQKPEDSSIDQETSDHSDIEDELATLLGMKCAVYHTHKWGGQPSLYNAMVSSVIPRQDNDQFKDLQVRVLFTHPTHAEMLPCPFLLEGECRFSDEQCRYSHGDIVPLSSLKEAIEPSFETVRAGSRVLVKLKPPDGEDVSLAKKSTEKYHLWHRAVVKHLDTDKRVCMVKLEHGVNTGEKRKTNNEEFSVNFEELYPLINDEDSDSDSNDSLSDTEYPQNKSSRQAMESDNQALLIEKSLQSAGPAMGEWERHTRGIGSKLMLAMGYVPGTGLGAAADGRLRPVEARAVPLGRSLDHCMELSEKYKDQDPLKVEQKLKRMQRKEEERIKRAYDREKERERRNVFNFLNKTLGDKGDKEDAPATTPTAAIKQSTNKNLNIEQFKITEETKRIEREITRLNVSLTRHSAGTDGHRTVNRQIAEKNKELDILKSKGQQITNEQRLRKDKQKMTVF